ncbi:hypothetical protein E4191_17185 (plasmid) [Paracoccus liaowanqingii]|uniref:Uncharacterized protein n=1 Tax=Paracoccus liaowanqingii TaxID=2560053 RepID=A0A4Y5ST50_9RHOB|nr:hypothetical protein [Paracoccus liaowanqingii]QDA35884.1 hypothetical protein E4191_17185 [Paracoccus liaowanqingii]
MLQLVFVVADGEGLLRGRYRQVRGLTARKDLQNNLISGSGTDRNHLFSPEPTPHIAVFLKSVNLAAIRISKEV